MNLTTSARAVARTRCLRVACIASKPRTRSGAPVVRRRGMMPRMTANLVLVVLAPAVVLAFLWTVTLLERRRGARREAATGARRGTAEGPFTRAPEDCPHDDVAADWHPAVAAWRSGIFTPPAPGVLDQGGTCRR